MFAILVLLISFHKLYLEYTNMHKTEQTQELLEDRDRVLFTFISISQGRHGTLLKLKNVDKGMNDYLCAILGKALN